MQRGLGELNRRLKNIEEKNFPNFIVEDTLFSDISIYGEQAIYDEIECFGEDNVIAILESYLEIEKQTFNAIENFLEIRRNKNEFET